MQEQTIVEAIMDTRGQVDFLWQFFMTVQIAIFALIFIYDEAVDTLRPFARFMAIGAVGFFDWINANALFDAYQLLAALHDQFRADFGAISKYQTLFYNRFVLATYEGKEFMLMVTHGAAFAVVAMALLWRGFIQHRRKATPAAMAQA